MRKLLFLTLLAIGLLFLTACDDAVQPEQVDPALWSINAEAPPITEDAFHFLHLHGAEDIYLYLGMTREDVREFLPNIGYDELVILPQMGSIGFTDNDRIDAILIFGMRWTTPSGIAAGSDWDVLEERIGEKYNFISSEGSFFVHFTRDHIPVHPESEKWEYRSYNVSFTKHDSSNSIGMIHIRSRLE